MNITPTERYTNLFCTVVAGLRDGHELGGPRPWIYTFDLKTPEGRRLSLGKEEELLHLGLQKVGKFPGIWKLSRERFPEFSGPGNFGKFWEYSLFS